MIGLGTIINVSAVIVAGIIGLAAGHFLTERFEKIVSTAIGLSVICMSVSGVVAKMLVVTPDGVGTQGIFTLIFALVTGALLGELMNIDYQFERFGGWLKKVSGSVKDKRFVDGFVTASMSTSIGAMAVMGAVMDGVKGDYSILLTKSVIDFVLILVMTATMGRGCIFAAVPIGVFQGLVTLFARLISPLMNELATNNLSMVGSALIICIGINILCDGKFRIKVLNLLPAVVLAVLAAYIPFLQYI